MKFKMYILPKLLLHLISIAFFVNAASFHHHDAEENIDDQSRHESRTPRSQVSESRDGTTSDIGSFVDVPPNERDVVQMALTDLGNDNDIHTASSNDGHTPISEDSRQSPFPYDRAGGHFTFAEAIRRSLSNTEEDQRTVFGQSGFAQSNNRIPGSTNSESGDGEHSRSDYQSLGPGSPGYVFSDGGFYGSSVAPTPDGSQVNTLRIPDNMPMSLSVTPARTPVSLTPSGTGARTPVGPGPGAGSSAARYAMSPVPYHVPTEIYNKKLLGSDTKLALDGIHFSLSPNRDDRLPSYRSEYMEGRNGNDVLVSRPQRRHSTDGNFDTPSSSSWLASSSNIRKQLETDRKIAELKYGEKGDRISEAMSRMYDKFREQKESAAVVDIPPRVPVPDDQLQIVPVSSSTNGQPQVGYPKSILIHPKPRVTFPTLESKTPPSWPEPDLKLMDRMNSLDLDHKPKTHHRSIRRSSLPLTKKDFSNASDAAMQAHMINRYNELKRQAKQELEKHIPTEVILNQRIVDRFNKFGDPKDRKVKLHIYAVKQGMLGFFGAFHFSVEVFGLDFDYGYGPTISDVSTLGSLLDSVTPKQTRTILHEKYKLAKKDTSHCLWF